MEAASPRAPRVPGFSLDAPLGEDGGAWRGRRDEDDRAAVVKLLTVPDPDAVEATLAHFRQLASIAATTSSSLLVEGLGCGKLDASTVWVATPLFEHGSLADQLEDGPLPEERALRYALQVARALRLLHAHGVAHGGIRPTKLLLADERRLRVSDSSTAHGLGERSRAFLAPEFTPSLARGPSGASMDLYSLGATLYSCLTGGPPPAGLPDLFALERFDIRRPVQALLDRLLDLDPRRRLSDAGELVGQLEQLLGTVAPEEVIPAPGPAPLGRCGSYELVEEVARGGMGIVFRARHAMLGRAYAVKRLLFGDGASKPRLQRFMREARTLARLQHPGVIAIHEVDFADGAPYLAMDFVAGGSLAQRLQEEGPFGVRRAAALVQKLAAAMDYVHGEGIVHRDLKPANILLEEDGRPRIGDFGIAADLASDDGLTRTGAVLGTLQYMAPEQVEGRRDAIGPATDIYALGAILYELLVGAPPFRAELRSELTKQILSHEPLPPSQLRPEVPRDLGAITCRALAKEPGRRYRNAAALAADLRRFLTGQPVVARPVSRLERGMLWVRRHPTRFAVIVGIALLSLALLTSLGFLRERELRSAAREAEKRGLAVLTESPVVARAELERAIALDASLFGAQRALGRLLIQAGEPAAALEPLRRAAVLAPDDEVQSLLGRALLATGDRAGAREAFDYALALGGEIDDRLRLARLLVEDGEDLAEALALLAEVVEARPRDADAVRLQLVASGALELRASAEDARWRLLALAPDDPSVLPVLVDTWLARLDAPSLARGWQTVHRHAEPGKLHALTRVLEHEKRVHGETAQDDQAPPGERLRAILALGRFPHHAEHTILTGLCALPSPVLAEAAWASRLCVAPADFAHWLDQALACERFDGALQAMTLAELWRKLPQLPREQLARLVDARGWRLRASYALTLALAGAHWTDLHFDPEPGLQALRQDADPRVRATAESAQEALLLSRQRGGSAETAVELALAFTLANRSSSALAATTEACRRELRRRLQQRPDDPALRLVAARDRIEAGDWLAANDELSEAFALAPDSQEIAVLRAVMRLVLASDSSGLIGLSRRDPVAAAEVRQRADFASRYGVVPLPGPAGSSILSFALGRDSHADFERGFSMRTVFPYTHADDGISLAGRVRAYSRFACSDVLRCTIDADGMFGLRVDAEFFRQVGLFNGWEMFVDSHAHMWGNRRRNERPGTRQIFHDRHGAESRRDERQIHIGGPIARTSLGLGALILSGNAVQDRLHTLRSVRLVAYLEEPQKPPSPPQKVRPLEHRGGPITILSPNLEVENLPATLEELFDRRVTMPIKGQWVGGERSSPIFRIARTSGDFEVWTVVETDSFPLHAAGIGCVTARSYFDACRLEYHGPASNTVHPRGAVLRLQGGLRWDETVHEVALESPVVLGLRRQDDWFTAFACTLEGVPEPLAPPLYAPHVGQHVDLVLYTRGICHEDWCDGPGCEAHFSQTVVMTEPEP